MGMLGFLNQRQQQGAQQEQQGIQNQRADQQLGLQERQVAMQENESYAKILQMGKDLELSDMQLMKAAEMQGLDAQRMQAEIANTTQAVNIEFLNMLKDSFLKHSASKL